jgi:hypothetical protein
MRHLEILGCETARRLGFLALAMLGTGMTCDNHHVGRPCELGTARPVDGTPDGVTTISSPALECPSHLCLLPSPEDALVGTGPLCTASCESDADCEGGESRDANNPADTRCQKGFVCTWATKTGAYACQRLCVCRDFVTEPPGGFTKPIECP